jgi:DNA segregation ATPase FtsK/SpoIIIE-like protein
MKTTVDGVDVLIGSTGRENVYCTLDDKPHLFIEAPTGYGKSEMLRSMLDDLIRNYSSEELQIYIGDMKQVEAKGIFSDSRYNDHVVAHSHTIEADSVINWLDKIIYQLESRVHSMAKATCRNIWEYRKQQHILSRVVVVFDEISAALANNYTEREHVAIAKRIEILMRLGRPAGFHLVATSSSAATLTENMARSFSHYVQLTAMGLAAFEGKILEISINAS